MRKTRFAAAGLLCLALSACATPEARVAARLEQVGLKPHMAHCLAHRLVKRLSRDQLRQLGSLPRAGHAQSLDEFLYRVRALDDPHIVKVSVRSAALCATGLAD